MISTVLKKKYSRKLLSNQNIFMCRHHGHLETSVHKHQLTTHKINFSLHVIWPFKDDSRQSSILASFAAFLSDICPLFSF